MNKLGNVDDLEAQSSSRKVLVTSLIGQSESMKAKTWRSGKINDYLKIILGYKTPGVVRLYMKEYIHKLYEEFPHMGQIHTLKKVASPPIAHLVNINSIIIKLDDKSRE